jgi:hypothetical protein
VTTDPKGTAEPTLKSTLDADLAAAEAELNRLRAANAALAQAFRAEPTDTGRELLRRGAISLAAARDRADAAGAALEVFRRTGSPHGLFAEGGRLVGSIAVAIPAGASREQRDAAIDAVLGAELAEVARSLGAVLAASPVAYTKERPGRDAEGRTVLEVAGRIEGDVLAPAVSRSAKTGR